MGRLSLLIHTPHGSSSTSTFRPRAWPPSSSSRCRARKTAPQGSPQAEHTSREPGIGAKPFPHHTSGNHSHGTHLDLRWLSQVMHTPHRVPGTPGQLSKGMSSQPQQRAVSQPDRAQDGQSCTLHHECKAHSYDPCQPQSHKLSSSYSAIPFTRFSSHVQFPIAPPSLPSQFCS